MNELATPVPGRASKTVKGIEPMVQKLILKARQAKAGHGKQTEPLLDEHDNTITKALDVAQRAI